MLSLKPTTPQMISNSIRSLFSLLDLEENDSVFIQYTKELNFKAEVDNCHINNMVKQKLSAGEIVYGWRIWEDKNNNFVEANFHSLWEDNKGKLFDITPRKDGERKILFAPDHNRSIELIEYNNLLAIKTYDNFKILNGVIQNGIKKIIIIVKTQLYSYLF